MGGAGWSEPIRQSPRQQRMATDARELGRAPPPAAAPRLLAAAAAAAAATASDASDTDARSASSGVQKELTLGALNTTSYSQSLGPPNLLS